MPGNHRTVRQTAVYMGKQLIHFTKIFVCHFTAGPVPVYFQQNQIGFIFIKPVGNPADLFRIGAMDRTLAGNAVRTEESRL